MNVRKTFGQVNNLVTNRFWILFEENYAKTPQQSISIFPLRPKTVSFFSVARWKHSTTPKMSRPLPIESQGSSMSGKNSKYYPSCILHRIERLKTLAGVDRTVGRAITHMVWYCWRVCAFRFVPALFSLREERTTRGQITWRFYAVRRLHVDLRIWCIPRRACVQVGSPMRTDG